MGTDARSFARTRTWDAVFSGLLDDYRMVAGRPARAGAAKPFPETVPQSPTRAA
jgi:hypothetical protein